MPEKSSRKIVVSDKWNEEERQEVASALRTDIEHLKLEEEKLRETIKWEAPCFQEINRKRDQIGQLLSFCEEADPEFLQLNRSNFSDYIVD